MTTTWTIAVDWERTGDFNGTYDDITDYVMDARWFNGFRRPYQDVADEQMLSLSLNNSDKRFSPENAGSPLADDLAPFRPVRLQSNDGTTVRTHYLGWLEKIEPSVNQFGERTTKLTCSGAASLFMASAETDIAVQQNKRANQIINTLLDEIQVPPPLIGSAIIGLPTSIIGSVNIVDVSMDRSLEIGKTVFAYAADNWIQGNDQNRTFSIYSAIKDIVAGERGRFYFNREGQAIFWNRHHLIVNRTIEATFDNTMVDMKYSYASLDEFSNDISVTCHPRTISPNGDVILWQLDNPITVQPGDTREIGASFHDDSDNRIGGKDIYLSGVSITGNGSLMIENVGANRAKLVLKNHSSQYKITLNSANVRGYKITDFGRVESYAKDNLSIVKYGRRDMKMTLRSIDNQDDAQGIADFELMRRRTPSGKVQTISLKSQAKRGGNQHSEQLARTIGDRIKIIESQTGHTGEYFIIGEEQRLSQQATLLETTWYLESATEGDFFMIGEDVIGSGATLLPI